MEKRCEECGSVNLVYDEYLGEFICNDCGIVMEENISQEQEYKKRTRQPNQSIKWNFSSGLQRDKEKENYQQDPQVKEFLREIYQLEFLLKETIGSCGWEIIKGKMMDFLKYNYDNGLPKTREKRVLIWAILISIFETEIINLEKQDKMPESRKYKIALEKLSNKEKETYDKSQRMRDKILPLIAKIIEDKTKYETYVIDLSRVDPKSKNISKKGLHELFSKESMLIPHQEAGGEIIQNRINIWERDVHNAAVEVARIFIQTILTNEKKIGKKEGLLCACAYLVCKQNNFKPLFLEKWAEFFEISNRCLKDRVKEIRNTLVPCSIQQPPLELQIKERKLLLIEKVQKQD